MIEKIKQELLDDGLDPNDFKITVKDGVGMVTPKWGFEMKQIARREDKETKERLEATEIALMELMMEG